MTDFRNVCDKLFHGLETSWPKHQEAPKPLNTIQAHGMIRPGSTLDFFHLIHPVAAEASMFLSKLTMC